MRPERPDHYATLGLPTTASPGQITHAYRALVRTLHPDTATAPGDTLARFTAVTTAYQVLHDPARRAAYDRTQHTPPPDPAPPAAPRTRTRTRTRTTVQVTILPPPAPDTITAKAPSRHDMPPPLLRAGPTRVTPLPHHGP
jgi:curved DNA-binding protein CbpA